MNDFSKQHMAQEEYKNLRTKPVEEYNGDFESQHYTEVKNQAIKQEIPSKKDTFRSDYQEDFDKASRDFWQRNTQKGLQKYNAGCFTANFGREVYTVDELLERISRFIKECVTNELIEHGLSTEELQENFKSVEISLKLLGKSLEKLDPDFSIDGMSAHLHGFINSYVSSFIVKKLDRDKGKVK